jgi:hypothetical protein
MNDPLPANFTERLIVGGPDAVIYADASVAPRACHRQRRLAPPSSARRHRLPAQDRRRWRWRRQAFRQRAAVALGRLDAGVELARLVELEGAHRQVVLPGELGQEVFDPREPGASFGDSFRLVHPVRLHHAERRANSSTGDSTGLCRRDSVAASVG